jgi:hypothetical protein
VDQREDDDADNQHDREQQDEPPQDVRGQQRSFRSDE